jgi:hypothetical protein
MEPAVISLCLPLFVLVILQLHLRASEGESEPVAARQHKLAGARYERIQRVAIDP